MRGATRIIGVDVNPDKFEIGNTNWSTVLIVSWQVEVDQHE